MTTSAPPPAQLDLASTSLPAGAVPSDPPAARVVFLLLGNRQACVHLLVASVVLAGLLVLLWQLAPGLAYPLVSGLVTVAGGYGIGRWRRTRRRPDRPPPAAHNSGDQTF